MLARSYVDEAKQAREPPFTTDEIKKVINKLKPGKAAGTDQIPPEMYIYSSYGMIEFIISVLNNLKLHTWNPDQWDNMAITTIYKRVGPKKILRNHRGIFLTQVISKM